MKAFEKWWKELLCSNDKKAEYIANKAWKEALEEVLKIIHEQKPEDVQEIIEKELED